LGTQDLSGFENLRGLIPQRPARSQRIVGLSCFEANPAIRYIFFEEKSKKDAASIRAKKAASLGIRPEGVESATCKSRYFGVKTLLV
jgi:hypothetical protein